MVLAGTADPTFLPWLRQGLAAHIDSRAVDGLAPHDSATATVAVRLVAEGDSTRTEDVPSPPIRLRGPADVVGLAATEIARCEPVDGTTDAEPNYFAHLELASPDLPWRFTPAAADGKGRLQPWLALVVVEDRAGVSLEHKGEQAAAVLQVDDASLELPDLAQCWAWAHVQADCAVDGGVAAALLSNPSAFRARLMCPRRLLPERSWIACVVPTFEAGRRAGLGEAVGQDLGLAWTQTDFGVRLPVYHSWRFSTGPRGDFESLVRRLTARELAGTVGRRDLDVSSPGEPLPTVPELFLSFKGALVAPGGQDRPWPARHHLATVETFRDLIRRQYDASADDPVVGAPAYGAAQAPGVRDAWFGELNTEPPHRVVASLGASVVRRDQEAMMAAAWQHAAEHRGVNRLLGRARLGWEVARVAQSKLEVLSDPELVQLAGPAMPRLRAATGDGTLRATLAGSALPQGLVSGAMRRQCRTVAGLSPVAELTGAALADTAGFVAAWQSVRPPVGAHLQSLPSSTSDSSPPAGSVFTSATGPAAIGQAGSAAVGQASASGSAAVGRAGVPKPAVGRAVVGGSPIPAAAAPPEGEAGRAMPAARSANRVRIVGQASVAVPKPATDIAGQVRAVLEPAGAIAKMVAGLVQGMPSEVSHPVPGRVWARPRFTNPMYGKVHPELLLPGAGDIPPDTLGLLETNPQFAEAFLTGLNHELAREFRWREYPASLDDTWARHFWDTGPEGPADIVPIGRWEKGTDLGTHRPKGTAAADLVLIIKGALPRRYPDMRVYAAEAQWSADGTKRLEKEGGIVKLPVLAGKIGRDIHFYGFALTPEAARGSTDPARHPGYFLVLEQRPESIRFGLDVARKRFRGEAPGSWADLSWAHLVTEDEPLPGFVDAEGPRWMAAAGELPGNGGKDSWGDDAAAMARITLQRPVRMLTHASGMLPEGVL